MGPGAGGALGHGVRRIDRPGAASPPSTARWARQRLTFEDGGLVACSRHGAFLPPLTIVSFALASFGDPNESSDVLHHEESAHAGLRAGVGITNTALVLVLIGVALWLRLPALGASELSFTDSWVALIVHLDSLADVARVGITTPGFTLLAKLWFTLVGFSATAAQVPALVAGVVAPGAIYLLGRRMGMAMVPSVAAGLFMALSPQHLVDSTRFKQYTLESLAGLVLLAIAWGVLEAEDERVVSGRLCVLAVTAVVFSFGSASIAPVALAAVLGGALRAFRIGLRRKAIVATASYLGVFGVWAVLLVRRITSDRLAEYWDRYYITGLSDARRVLLRFGSGLGGTDSRPVVWVLALLAFAGALWLLKRHPEVGVLLVGPVAIAAGLALIGRVPLGTGRTDIYLYPVLILGGAYVLSHLVRPWWAQALVIVPLILLALPPVVPRYSEVGAVPLVELIEARRTPDDQVVANYGTVYTLAVYGPWMEGLETGVDDVRGFMPSWNDPGIVGIERKDGPEEFQAALTNVVEADRVWMLFAPRTQPWTREVISQVMTDGGYELAFEDENRRSYVQLWAKS